MEKAANLARRVGSNFGGTNASRESNPTPIENEIDFSNIQKTHVVMPVRHVHPMTGKIQIAQTADREL